MVIRSEQAATLKDIVSRRFEDEMMTHLDQFSPETFVHLGEDRFRATIRLGMERAQTYGFDQRGPTRLYLEAMLLFGSFFDTDPQYPWFSEMLSQEKTFPQMTRAQCLHKRIVNYRDSVEGPDRSFESAALRKLNVLARQPDATPEPTSLPEVFRTIYPQKADYLGGDLLGRLISTSTSVAQQYGLATSRGQALFLVLSLTFGHGCASDPLHPWIAKILSDCVSAPPDQRTRRLNVWTLALLDRVQARAGKGDAHVH